MKQLAHECDSRGLISTVQGDIDENTALYGLFHCIKAGDGTVTVTYAIHRLFTETKRKGILPNIQAFHGIKGIEAEKYPETNNSLMLLATSELGKLGVDTSSHNHCLEASGSATMNFEQHAGRDAVSYTHLTLPTKRIV